MFYTANAQNNPVIAHRGAWAEKTIPQNSRASLKKAIELKCYGSEFDVHLTKDNILVVNHDNEFLGKDIASATYKELLSLKMSNGETIPTVEEFIKIAKKKNKHKTKLIYEIKTSPLGRERTKETVRESVDLIKKMKMEDMTEFILFDYESAKELVAIYPQAKVHSLTPVTPQKIKEDGLTGLDFHFSVYDKNPTYIPDAKKLGLKTNVWTVNKKEDMVRFLDLGIDYITTDRAAELLEIVKERNQK
ncbi:glycerophosphodiester phosphodiesterase [Pseudopedobacter saltans]|nr:glycerophosphodiester phosphodiesterase family protein [Pseudopedobacter saltans]